MRFDLPFLHRRNPFPGPFVTGSPSASVYLSHFGLQDKPFELLPDPKFLWLGRKRKRLLLKLRYEVLRQDGGCVVITGNFGIGKTALATLLMNELGNHASPAKISCPKAGLFDLYKLISSGYALQGGFADRGSFPAAFESFLRDSFSLEKKRGVLIFDEAQRLTLQNLTDLLPLSELGENGLRWLSLVFVGENEFNNILLQESHRALRRRINFNCRLSPLSEEETGEYVLHRLAVAGGKKEIFTPKALTEVFQFSRGIPLRINEICDAALLNTYMSGGKKVLPPAVRKSARQLRGPAEAVEEKGNEPGFLPQKEGKPGEGTEGFRTAKPQPQGVRRSPEKKSQARIVWAAAGVLAVILALFFLLPQPGPFLENLISPVSKEVIRTTTATAKGAMDLFKKAVPSVVPWTKEQAVFPDRPAKVLVSPAPPGESRPLGKVASPQKVGPRGMDVKKEGPAAVESKIPAKAAKQASPPSRGEEKDFYAKGQSLIEKGFASLEGKMGGTGQSPASKAKPGVPVSSSKDTEEMEAGKAIEWLIEKKTMEEKE